MKTKRHYSQDMLRKAKLAKSTVDKGDNFKEVASRYFGADSKSIFDFMPISSKEDHLGISNTQWFLAIAIRPRPLVGMDNLLRHQELKMARFQQQTQRTDEDLASELIDRITADIDF